MSNERLTAERVQELFVLNEAFRGKAGYVKNQMDILNQFERDVAAEARKAASIDSDKPQRRFVATIKVGADDEEKLIVALQDITTEIAMKLGRTGSPCCDSVSGSPSSGSIVVVVKNRGVTHDSYFKDIERWREARRRSGEKPTKLDLPDQSPLMSKMNEEDLLDHFGAYKCLKCGKRSPINDEGALLNYGWHVEYPNGVAGEPKAHCPECWAEMKK